MEITKCWLQTDYPNISYRTKSGLPKNATVASGGCGFVSTMNILYNYLGHTELTITAMRDLAVNSNARYNGGTDVKVLLEACLKKFGGFTFERTTSDSKMKNHISNGGCAVMHTPGTTSLFSDSGHFVSACGIKDNRIQVMDSYWYSNKWSYNSTRRAHIRTTSIKGVVYADYSAVVAACDYYYLIKRIENKSSAIFSQTVIATADVNPRRTASASGQDLGTITKGSKLHVLDGTNNWLRCYAWVHKNYFTVKDHVATATANVNPRYKASVESEDLGTITKGAKLNILGMSGEWIKVQFYIAKKHTKQGEMV